MIYLSSFRSNRFSITCLLAIFFVASIVSQVSSRPEFLELIPNGALGEDRDAGIGCKFIGHDPCAPGMPRNQFGLDFKAAGFKWTKELCETDSDGDGLSNGHELGDPCCQWTPGNDQVLRTCQLSHPGDSASMTNFGVPSCDDAASLNSSSSRTALCSSQNGPTKTPVVLPSYSPIISSSNAFSTSPDPNLTKTVQPSSCQVPSPSDSVIQPTNTPILSNPTPSPLYSDGVSPAHTPSQPASNSPLRFDSPSPSVPASTINSTDAVLTETPEFNQSPDSSGEAPVCFPESATVYLVDGSRKSMHSLRIGDTILSAPGHFSSVFMFTHRMSEIIHQFVVLSTTHTNISLTSGHFLYVNGELAPAGNVRCGDRIRLHNGSEDVVKNISFELKRGLYNPQTMHGDIVVNGVHASTYTKTVSPFMAHGLLAPLRMIYHYIGWSATFLDFGFACLSQWIS